MVPMAWPGSSQQMSYIYGGIRTALEQVCTPTACRMPYQASAMLPWCIIRSALFSLQMQLQLLMGRPHGGRHAYINMPLQDHETSLDALQFVLVEGAVAAALWPEGTLACRMQHMCQ